MQEIANTIILIGGVLGAIYAIYLFFVRPFKWSKQKKQEIDTDISKKIEEAVSKALIPVRKDLDELATDMQELREINEEQYEKLEWMNSATLDLLRQEILYLYNHHYQEKKLTVDENDQLHKLYDSYVAGGGNSFVGDLMKSISTWEIIPNGDREHK